MGVQGLLQAQSNLNSTQQAQLAGAPQALSDIITVWSHPSLTLVFRTLPTS